jgi:hypothetical protein
MTFDPGYTKHMVWDITLVACDPWWYSTELISSWTNTAGTGSGTLIFENPADQECWVEFAGDEITATETWTLPDGVAVYPVGHALAGQQVKHTLPALAPGRDFLVQTHPLKETLMVMDATQQWATMKSEDFLNSNPTPQEPTTVAVSLVGGTTASTISAFMVQRHDRPWG